MGFAALILSGYGKACGSNLGLVDDGYFRLYFSEMTCRKAASVKAERPA